MSLEAASTISMCGLTAAQGLFTRLQFPCHFAPSPEPSKADTRDGPTNVLIYGSSTSLGLYAAQLVRQAAKASGRQVRLIGVAGPSKYDLLRAAPYSYDLLFDYKDADWATAVRGALQGQDVDYALDCISEGSTVYKTESTLGPRGRLAVFRGPKGGQYDPSALRVKPIYGAVWEGLGKEIGYNGEICLLAAQQVLHVLTSGTGAIIPANPAAREFATKFYNYLALGDVEPNPMRLMPGGLERLPLDGLLLFGDSRNVAASRQEEYMRPISGEKLVYKVI